MKKWIAKLANRTLQHNPNPIRMVAIVVRGGHVVAVGRNHNDRPAVRFDPRYFSRHAECAALSKIKNSKGAEIYVFRILRTGLPAMARPCPICQVVLRARGIRRAHYTTSTPPFWETMKI